MLFKFVLEVLHNITYYKYMFDKKHYYYYLLINEGTFDTCYNLFILFAFLLICECNKCYLLNKIITVASLYNEIHDSNKKFVR